ncbi:glycosyltransferase [Aeromonas hydrophila]|uniref:glycosyltransferase n=1 Tax=Aeromonas hydrophila TaxID=644 RepID=UPI003D228992
MPGNKVAVIMSVYMKDVLKNVSLAVNSILEQTYKNIDLYIMIDGEISNDVSCFLNSIKNKNVILYDNPTNRGLAYRLNQAIRAILKSDSYLYIARMDADDISVRERIEVQVKFLQENLNVDVVGSDVIEINDEGEQIFYKKMCQTHNEIIGNIIKKCPFNHPSVMFRIDVFNSGVLYNESLMNTQDYYLWIDLLALGFRFGNINKPLLFFRVDSKFHDRRGFSKAVNDLNSRIYAFKKIKSLTLFNVLHTVLLFSLRLSPPFIKKIAYKLFR